jgi:outer membrane receptor protein involved in Fe transport
MITNETRKKSRIKTPVGLVALSLLAAAATSVNLPWLKAQASLLSANTRDQTRRNRHLPAQHPLTPAVAVSFKPFGKQELYLRAFAKKTFRLPTFNDLYYTITGAADLRPEKAVQYNAGVTYGRELRGCWHQLTLQADVYRNRVSDKIIAMPTSKFFRWTMLNLGRVETLGVDASAHVAWRVGAVYLKTALNYGFQQAQDRTNPRDSYYGDQIPYTPRHSGSLTLTGEYRGWGFNYSFIYVGERYSQQENTPVNRLQPWYTHDVSLYAAWDVGGCRLKAQLDCGNLLNQYYAVVSNYPMPGRNFKLGCYVEF